MQRYALKLQYDGTHYVGYQIQTNGPSIQGAIQTALQKLAQVDSEIIIANTTSGRTDAGVHALGQVIHVDYPKRINAEGMRRGLNSLLSPDIRVLAVSSVDNNFHARYSAIGKEYLYRIDLSEFPDPFKRLYTMHHPYPYDLNKIKVGMNYIIGTHDFTSFCSTKTEKVDKVRTIYEAEVWEDKGNNELIFSFHGNGFLYNMVRVLVGTLLQIGNGLRLPKEMEHLLQIKDRNQAGPTASPQGLYLVRVDYPQEIFI